MKNSRRLSLLFGLFSSFVVLAERAGAVSFPPPGASVFFPYFDVSVDGPDLFGSALDTQYTLRNVSTTHRVLVKLEVWSPRGVPWFGLLTALQPGETLRFSASQLIRGDFNLSQAQVARTEFCGRPEWERFRNPDAGDRFRARSGLYPVPALPAARLASIRDGLDSSPDGDCGPAGDGVLTSPILGFMTADVVNYCTLLNPDEAAYYTNDALATAGWPATPNVLQGSFQRTGSPLWYPASAVFEPGLDWVVSPTIYSVQSGLESSTGSSAPLTYRFRGDGRRHAVSYLGVWRAGARLGGLWVDAIGQPGGREYRVTGAILPPARRGCRETVGCPVEIFGRDGGSGPVRLGTTASDPNNGRFSATVRTPAMWLSGVIFASTPADCRVCPSCESSHRP